MRLLALDCCLAACSVAVADASTGRRAARFEARSSGHAEALVLQVRDAAAEAGIDLATLTRIGLTNGPGTFTGVRVAVGAARALALASGAEVVAVTSLALVAAGAVCGDAAALPTAFRCLVALAPGPRNELLVQRFAADGRRALSGPQVMLPEAIAATFTAGDLAVGPGAAALALAGRRLGMSIETASETLLPDARHLLNMLGELTPLDAPPVPVYLRPPDARPPAVSSIARKP